MTIEIHLSSAAVPELEESAKELLRAAAEAEPESGKPIYYEKPSKGDPIAVAALILSIPSSILAIMDIVERAKLAEKIRDFLDKARKTGGTATLHVGTESTLDLKSATEDEVIDLMAKSQHPGN